MKGWTCHDCRDCGIVLMTNGVTPESASLVNNYNLDKAASEPVPMRTNGVHTGHYMRVELCGCIRARLGMP